MALNDKQIQILLSARDNASATLAKLDRSLDQLNNTHSAGAISADKQSMSIGKLATSFGLGTLAANGVMKAISFAEDSMKGFVQSAAGLQETSASFEVLLGNGEKTKSLLNDISVMAAKTPFEFPELADTAKNLLAYGVQVQDILPWLNRLGDLSAGNSEKFKTLSLVFGQVKSAGRLMGQDLLQLTQTGIPIIDALAQVLGTTKEKVRDLVSEGSVDFDEFAKAMSLLSDKGGKFYGLMDRQSQTLNGRMSTLKDTWNQFGRTLLGVSQDGTIKAGGLFDRLSDGTQDNINWLSKLTEKVQKWSSQEVESSSEVKGAIDMVKLAQDGLARAKDDQAKKSAAYDLSLKEETKSLDSIAQKHGDIVRAQEAVTEAERRYGANSPQTVAAVANLQDKEQALNDAMFDNLDKSLKVKGAHDSLRQSDELLADATRFLTDMTAGLSGGLMNLVNTIAKIGPMASLQVKPIADLGANIENVIAKFNGMVQGIQPQLNSINARLQGTYSTIDRLQNAAGNLQQTIKGIEIQSANLPKNGLQGNYGTAPVPGVYQAHADGGVFRKPHFGLVAEAGPEAIIPLNDSRRAREVMNEAGLTGSGVGTVINQTNHIYRDIDLDEATARLAWGLANA